MTQLPPDELAALPKPHELNGISVLELGNKKNSTGIYADWYRTQGASYLSVDWNGMDGAKEFDMRQRGVAEAILDSYHGGAGFPVVTNFGFTEHVGETLDEQLSCWRNVHALIAENGLLCVCMPLMPWWKGHGIWMPTIDWYMAFAEQNGYLVECAQQWKRVRPTFVARMRKLRGAGRFSAPKFGKILRSDGK